MESIKDKVAITGMGGTKFGERWDAGLDDLAIEAAYEAYEDAAIDPDDIQACWHGSDGGPKCFGHPVGASGLRMTYEVYKQLQGKAQSPERQLKDAKLGISQTFGGPSQVAAVAVLGKEPGYL
jgi:acetyl-CoA acetyltransferase